MRTVRSGHLRGWLVLALWLVAGAAWGQPAPAPRAGDELIGLRITAVRLTLDGREIGDPAAVHVLETTVGAPLSGVAVRESLVHLMALGRFLSVRADVRAAAGGVALTYELTPLRPVRRLAFRGQLGLPARQLRTAVVERYTATPPASRADEIASMLEGFYRDRGYLRAVVRSGTELSRRGDSTTLVFQVTPGRQATVGSVEVEGAPGGNVAEVKAGLGVREGGRFDRLALDRAVARYVANLRARGFLEARVEADVTYPPDGTRADVRVRVTRGPLVAIELRGDPLPEARRAEILALFREGAVDEDLLENEERRIENDYRARGYSDAVAPYIREQRGDNALRIVFTVKQGPQYVIGSVGVAGNRQVPLAEIQPALHVEAGQWFAQARLDADVADLAEQYRKRGFRNAVVTWARTPAAGDPTRVDVRIAINEGVRTLVSGITFEGATVVGADELRQAVKSRPGGPYYQPQIDADRDAVLSRFQGRGYQLATVTVPPGFSQDGTQFRLRFVVVEGARTVVDRVLVVGNVHVDAQAIERDSGLVAGMPLSRAVLDEAQGRLSALGLFRRVQVTEMQRGEDGRRDVLVRVEEAPVNTIGYGGGFEGASRLTTNSTTGQSEQHFDMAPRGFFEVGRRNLWGRNRSVNLFARGAIRTSEETSTGASFHEYRVAFSYREPRFLDLPFDLAVTAAVDQAIRSSFDFNRRQLLAEGSHRFGSTISVAGRYAVGRTRFLVDRIAEADRLDIDKVFARVRVSAFSASIVRSTRDDPFDPTRGTLASIDQSVALRAIGSEVGFAKTFMQGFVYRQVPVLRGAIFAGGVRIGLATGFTQLVLDPAGSGQLVPLEQALPASERFFAGGDSTVRGFALDQLGSWKTLDTNGVANGGNALLIFNGEVRVPVWVAKGLGVATFIDAGNVFAKVGDIALGDLRSGAGLGLRWRSPVGPLRVDVAWKLHTITFVNGQEEGRRQVYVSIGQAF